MEVRFYNELLSHEPTPLPMMIWSKANEAPAEKDYINIQGGGKTTWIVRRRIWRNKLRVDVYCSPLDFDL